MPILMPIPFLERSCRRCCYRQPIYHRRHHQQHPVYDKLMIIGVATGRRVHDVRRGA